MQNIGPRFKVVAQNQNSIAYNKFSTLLILLT